MDHALDLVRLQLGHRRIDATPASLIQVRSARSARSPAPQGARRRHVPDIGDDGFRASPGSLDLGDQRRERLLVPGCGDHRRPAASEEQGRLSPYPRRGAGDDDDLIVEGRSARFAASPG